MEGPTTIYQRKKEKAEPGKNLFEYTQFLTMEIPKFLAAVFSYR
jgi:hypothetical protein